MDAEAEERNGKRKAMEAAGEPQRPAKQWAGGFVWFFNPLLAFNPHQQLLNDVCMETNFMKSEFVE